MEDKNRKEKKKDNRIKELMEKEYIVQVYTRGCKGEYGG